MNVLSYEELEEVKGGVSTKWYIIGGIAIFLIGIIAGIWKGCDNEW